MEDLERGRNKAMKEISLEIAKRMLAGAERYAIEIVGGRCSIAIVDKGGIVKAVHRMDGAPPGTTEIAIEKAWSAVAMEVPTLMLARVIDPRLVTAGPLGQSGFGMMGRHQGRICPIHGGIPIRETGTSLGMGVIGGIGTCGCADPADDNSVSQAGYAAVYS